MTGCVPPRPILQVLDPQELGKRCLNAAYYWTVGPLTFLESENSQVLNSGSFGMPRSEGPTFSVVRAPLGRGHSGQTRQRVLGPGEAHLLEGEEKTTVRQQELHSLSLPSPHPMPSQ